MRTIRGGSPIRVTIGTAAKRVLQVNRDRASFTLLADSSNTGTVYIAYDDPTVQATGERAGIPLAAGAQLEETAPDVFQGELYAIASAASQVLIVVEQHVIETEG